MAAFSGNKYYLLPFDLYQGFFKKMSTELPTLIQIGAATYK